MELIPSIDLRGGRVVRLEQGDYARETVYEADPVRQAQRFAAAGVARIHVVDLDAARDGRGWPHEPVVRAIAKECPGVHVQVGGGMRTRERIERAFDAGVDRVVVGTAALEAPELVRAAIAAHPQRIVLGLDAKGGRVAVRGWREVSPLSPGEVLTRYDDLPVAAVLHTEIGRDGLQQGPDVAGTAELARSTRFPVIASGGVGRLEHLEELAQTRVIAAAIVGRALYSGAIDLEVALARLRSC